MTLADWNDIASIWASALWRACWQGALAVGIVWLLCLLLPRLSPGTRTALWWLACLKMLLGLFVAGWIPIIVLPARPAPDSPMPTRAISLPMAATHDREESTTLPPAIATAAVAVRSVATPAEPLRPAGVLFLLWATGSLTMLGLLWREHRSVGRLIARAQPCTDRALMEGAARSCGLTRLPTVLISDTACSSLVVGLWKPKVLLCHADLEALGPDERRAVLTHELMHLRRCDLWAGLVPALARVLFFFHPLVWLTCREYELAREAACDAESLRASGLPLADYGKLLLKLSLPPSRLTPRPGLTAPGVASPQARLLLRRLRGLQELCERRTLSRGSSLLVLACFGTLLSLVPTRAEERAAPAPALIEVAPLPIIVKVAPSTPKPSLATAPTPTPPKPTTKGTQPTMKFPVRPQKLAPVLATAAVTMTASARLAPVAASPQEPAAPLPPPTIAAVAPAAPTAPQRNLRYQYTLKTGDSYSVHTQSDSVGSAQRKLADAQPGDSLVVDRDGKRYLITDPATLKKVRDNHAAMDALGKQMEAEGTAMGKEIEARMEVRAKDMEAAMEAKGKEMEALGEQMEALGEKMENASAEERKALSARMQTLSTEMQAKGTEMQAMGTQMQKEAEKLQKEAQAIGQRMQAQGKRMQAEAEKAEKRMTSILDEAFKKKLAIEQNMAVQEA